MLWGMLAVLTGGWILSVLRVRRLEAENDELRFELGKLQSAHADAVIASHRAAHALRVGEREAAALFLEKMEKGDWALWVRKGYHLKALGAENARALN